MKKDLSHSHQNERIYLLFQLLKKKKRRIMKSNSQCFLKTKLAFDQDYLRAFTCTLQTNTS